MMYAFVCGWVFTGAVNPKDVFVPRVKLQEPEGENPTPPASSQLAPSPGTTSAPGCAGQLQSQVTWDRSIPAPLRPPASGPRPRGVAAAQGAVERDPREQHPQPGASTEDAAGARGRT